MKFEKCLFLLESEDYVTTYRLKYLSLASCARKTCLSCPRIGQRMCLDLRKERKQQGDGKNCITRNFITCTPHRYIVGKEKLSLCFF
jgi:hypothetical protein